MYHADIWLEGLRKSVKNVSQDNRCPGSDQNRASPEYKAETFPPEPNCLTVLRHNLTSNKNKSKNKKETKLQVA
jgi:hypothetical protein